MEIALADYTDEFWLAVKEAMHNLQVESYAENLFAPAGIPSERLNKLRERKIAELAEQWSQNGWERRGVRGGRRAQPRRGARTARRTPRGGGGRRRRRRAGRRGGRGERRGERPVSARHVRMNKDEGVTGKHVLHTPKGSLLRQAPRAPPQKPTYRRLMGRWWVGI